MAGDPQFSGLYARVYDALHEAKPYAAEVDLALRHATESLGRRPASVVDVACGTGRHLAGFARAGLKVHGNDLSAGMLARAKERLTAEKARDVTLTQGLMQDIAPRQGGVELATAFYTAVGYLVEPADLDRFFRNLRGLLVPGGVFFADFWNGPRMARDFSPTRTKETETPEFTARRVSRVAHVAERNALRVDFRLEVQLKSATGSKAPAEVHEEGHLVRYHSLPEIQSLLLAYGFALVASGPFFDDAGATVPDCWNFYVCARKI